MARTSSGDEDLDPESTDAINARLRALRASTGLTKKDFADACGIDPKAWDHFENNRRRITLDLAKKVVKRWGVNILWIYHNDLTLMPSYLIEQIERAMAEQRKA